MVRERYPAGSTSDRCGRSAHRRGRPIAAGVARAMAAAITIVALLMATSSPAAAETEVEVETPLAGYFQAGVETVLLVTVTADQAVTGTIDVDIDGNQVSATRLEIEVPGGSAKTFAVPVTLEPWAGQPNVTVRTSDGQTRRPSVNLTAVGEAHPVAVFPSLVAPGLVERADLAIDIGQARLVPFDPARLELGPGVLNAAAAVVADPVDLETLSDEQAEALFAWVSLGGNLYVDGSMAEVASGPVGRALADGGSALVAEAGVGGSVEARAWLGGGSIVVTGDALNGGRYDGVIQPRFLSNQERPMFIDPGEVLGDLSVDAGFSARPIGAFVAVLLAYIALVGPILWLLLSRSRREPLMWLAVPALAVVMSLGIWGSGLFFRQGTTGSHVTVIGSVGLASKTSSDYMISSAGGGFTGVRLDEGWTQAANGFSPWDWRFQEAGFATPTLDGDRIGADVPPAGVVVLGVASDNPIEEPWAVEATVEGAAVSGTVTNRSSHALTEVAVFSGDRLLRLPDVAAGGSAEFEFERIEIPPAWEDPVQRELADGNFRRDGANSPAALTKWMSSVGIESRAGQLTVVGWTRDVDAPLSTLGGAAVTRGRTAYVSSMSVAGVVGASFSQPVPVSGATVRSRIIDFRWSGDIGGGLMAEQRRGAFEGEVQTLAFDLPPGAASEDLFLEVPAEVSAMDLWDGTEWVDAGVGTAGAGTVLVRIPDGAVVGGSVFVRALIDGPFGPPSVTSLPDPELPIIDLATPPAPTDEEEGDE